MKIILLFIIISCHSQVVKENNPYRENQCAEARLICNTSKEEFDKKSKSNYAGTFLGIGNCSITNSVEKAKEEAVNKALVAVAKSFQVRINSETILEERSTKQGYVTKYDDLFTEKIRTSSVALFRDIQPLIYYDEIGHSIFALVLIDKHKLDKIHSDHNSQIMEKAKNYFKLALNNFRDSDFSKALTYYYYSFYLSSQIRQGSTDYYDRKFNIKYDIKIESKEKILDILHHTRVHKNGMNQDCIDLNLEVHYVKPIMLNFIPILVNGQTTNSDNNGLYRIKVNPSTKQIMVQINFTEYKKHISTELYGYSDNDFYDNCEDIYNSFPVFLYQKEVKIEFVCDMLPEISSAQFLDYTDEDIRLKFYTSGKSVNQIIDIVENPDAQALFIGMASLIGVFKIKQHSTDQGEFLVARFEGVLVENKVSVKKIEIKSINILGRSKSDAIQQFKDKIMQHLLKSLK